MDIKPIETLYRGYRFRSRLEARWAVFFEALGVEYEYEPEGFKLDDGSCYLPDFKVKCWGYRGCHGGPPKDLYIEVKGEMSDADALKIRLFAVKPWDEFNKEDRDGFPLLVVGKIPASFHEMFDICNESMNGIYPFNYETIDGDEFGAYPAADADGHFYLAGADSNYINDEDVPRVNFALTMARSARFEHGETPKTK